MCQVFSLQPSNQVRIIARLSSFILSDTHYNILLVPMRQRNAEALCSGCRKRGIDFKRDSLRDGFAVVAVLEQTAGQRATTKALAVSAVLGWYEGCVIKGLPP